MIYASNLQRKAIHPSEKPVGLLALLISYACPPGELVIDPFAGSGSTLDAARLSVAGRPASNYMSLTPRLPLGASAKEP